MEGSGEETNLIRFIEKFLPEEDPARLRDVWRMYGQERLELVMNGLTEKGDRQAAMNNLVEKAANALNLNMFKVGRSIQRLEAALRRGQEYCQKLRAQLAQETSLKPHALTPLFSGPTSPTSSGLSLSTPGYSIALAPFTISPSQQLVRSPGAVVPPLPPALIYSVLGSPVVITQTQAQAFSFPGFAPLSILPPISSSTQPSTPSRQQVPPDWLIGPSNRPPANEPTLTELGSPNPIGPTLAEPLTCLEEGVASITEDREKESRKKMRVASIIEDRKEESRKKMRHD